MNITETLFKHYMAEFHLSGESLIKAVCNCVVPSQIFLTKYKSITPIEELEEKDKKELWLYVSEMFPEKTKEEKLNCCRIIHTIGTLL